MATYVTSLVSTESTILHHRIRIHIGRFAILTIANLRCAWALFFHPPGFRIARRFCSSPSSSPFPQPFKIIPTHKLPFISKEAGLYRDAFV